MWHLEIWFSGHGGIGQRLDFISWRSFPTLTSLWFRKHPLGPHSQQQHWASASKGVLRIPERLLGLPGIQGLWGCRREEIVPQMMHWTPTLCLTWLLIPVAMSPTFVLWKSLMCKFSPLSNWIWIFTPGMHKRFFNICWATRTSQSTAKLTDKAHTWGKTHFCH